MIYQKRDLNYSQTLKKTKKKLSVSERDLTMSKIAKCILNVQDSRKSSFTSTQTTLPTAQSINDQRKKNRLFLVLHFYSAL